MDSFEASNIVFSRIRKFEPENVTKKIIGYLLLQDRGHEMIRLAFGPDTLIHNLIYKTKIQLGLVSKPVVSPPISPSMNLAKPVVSPPISPSMNPGFSPFSPVSSPVTLKVPYPSWDPQVNPDHQPMHNPHFILQNRTQFMGLDDQLEPVNPGISAFSSDYYYPEATCARSPWSPTLSEFPTKACHYFNKGFCKHGSNCRSLEKLEFEITELLKSRRGHPVSIASLPMLYYEKYGRTLQAEGYLTESQRHGKAGFSLTKLLARLKNSIRLIDRPHGQHSVILAEDASKYMENRSERNDPGPIVSGSRQIYLTFPAESTFTEEDVANYFNTFGLVQDVRIPCQQRRMFGFVTFASADTVKMILSKGNPHYVCGARVLVKPYREKSKLSDRKYGEKLELPMTCGSHYTDMDSDLHSRWESSRLLGKLFMEEQEQDIEVQTRRFSELQLAQKPTSNQSYFGYSVDELKASEAIARACHSKFPSAERFNYLLDVLNSSSTSDDINPKHSGTNHTDSESQGFNLPESPFASPIVT